MPRGYINIQDVARESAVGPQDLLKAADKAGLAKFYFRGDVLYKDSDVPKLRELAAKLLAGTLGESTEEIDFAEAAEDSISGSGLFNDSENDDSVTNLAPVTGPPVTPPKRSVPNADMSGSGLFDLTDLAAQAAQSRSGPASGAKPAGVGASSTSLPKQPPGPAPGRPVDPTQQDSTEALVAIRSGSAVMRRPNTPSVRPPVQMTVSAAPVLPLGRFRPILASWEDDWNAASAGPFGPLFDPAEYLEPLEPGAPLPMDTRRCMLTDSGVVDQLKGVAAVLGTPEKHSGNPVIRPDTAWEVDGYCTLGGSVLYDAQEGRLKMWYSAVTKVGRAAGLAVSKDGLHWEKPALDVVQYEGMATNLVMAHPGVDSFAELAGVVLDPAADPPARYKAVFLYQNPQTAVRGLKTATSPDGVHWTAGTALLTAVTEVSRFFRDPRTGKYIIMGRLMRQGRRSVQRLESEDFVFWSNGEPVLEPDNSDPTTDDIYALGVLPYGRSYVGFVHIFHGPPQCTVDVQLAQSRDGWKWERAAEKAVFLPLGRPGEWDRYQVSACESVVAAGARDWLVFYSGRTARHAPYAGPDRGNNWGGIGVARLRRDGFLHMQGSFEGGTFVTQPMVIGGNDLHVNTAAAFGTLQVHLLDHEARPMDGMVSQLITADSVDHAVVWQSGKSLSGWLKRPMRLRFTLKNTRLFSFWTQ
jgi:hypothetical protein